MDGTLGEIRAYAGTFAPQFWSFCEGQLIAVSQNQELFSVIGSQFGGDGRTTFALPDLQGRAAIGAGTGPGLSPRITGARGGQETVTLTIPEIPNHDHTVNPGYAAKPNTENPQGSYPGNVGSPVYGSAASGGMGNAIVGSTGGGLPHQNMMPYTTVRWIICVSGLYPRRN